MTATTHGISDFTSPASHPRAVEIRWISVTAERQTDGGNGQVNPGRPVSHEIVLSLHLVDQRHALLEMWVQTPRQRYSVLRRQPVSCSITDDGHMLHLDAALDGRRVVSISLDHDDRLLYARSGLLEQAGFGAGSFDPPTLTCHRADRDVASA